ncbi:hypothetical protein GCM10023188_12730 [Pontibacter saemangeumensis]|uniref:Lipoprotein n=1 Tax=Pontibacter saemangeumensis TaxID=1084525 RepID=A0ABP8LGH7_9BACT
MKKVILMGSMCLALGMASCKTYCPAYNYATVETSAQETETAVAPVQKTAEVSNS